MTPNTGQTGWHRWVLCAGTSSSFKYWNVWNIKLCHNLSQSNTALLSHCWLQWDGLSVSSAKLPFHSHTVLLSRCQSQRANSPRALRLELIRKSWACPSAGAARIHPEPNVRHSSGRGEVNQQGMLHVTCYIMFNVCGYKLLSVVEHPMLTCKIANVEICI